MKRIVFLVVAVGLAWYFWIDGSKLTEPMVKEYYEQQWHATYSRDPEALCALYGSGLTMTLTSRGMGKNFEATLNKDEACKRVRDMFQLFVDIGTKTNSMLTIEYKYDIADLQMAADGKSATVEVTTLLKMGEEFMQIATESTEVLRRSLRKVKLVQAETTQRVRANPEVVANPEKYLKPQ